MKILLGRLTLIKNLLIVCSISYLSACNYNIEATYDDGSCEYPDEYGDCESIKLEEYLHYRNIDVSSLKELYKAWKGDTKNLPVKKSNHRAKTDILESIDEMKWYKENFLTF